MRGGIRHLNFHLRYRGIPGPAMQGVNLPVRRDRMTCPLIATAHHHLVETIQPAETVAALKIDISRIHDLFDGGIPPQSGAKPFNVQKVHAAGRAQRNCQAIFTANNDDFTAFLLAAVQDFLLNAERLIFNFQLITGNLPVSFLYAAFSTCQHPGFSRGMARNQDRQERKSEFDLHILSFLLKRLFTFVSKSNV